DRWFGRRPGSRLDSDIVTIRHCLHRYRPPPATVVVVVAVKFVVVDGVLGVVAGAVGAVVDVDVALVVGSTVGGATTGAAVLVVVGAAGTGVAFAVVSVTAGASGATSSVGACTSAPPDVDAGAIVLNTFSSVTQLGSSPMPTIQKRPVGSSLQTTVLAAVAPPQTMLS